jgi:hypothetical protein
MDGQTTNSIHNITKVVLIIDLEVRKLKTTDQL